jgi:MFS transporter, OFA family, oxalate/formate antiporter
MDGYLTVIGGICVHLVNGNIYLWGNISSYVISFYYNMGDKNATKEAATLVVPLSLLMINFGSPIGAYLMKKWHVKLVMLLANIVILVSILAASYMKTWYSFVFFYSVCYPFGIGLSYWTPIICAWEWFPNRKGFISGMILFGFGIGAFIFGFLSTALVNPHN